MKKLNRRGFITNSSLALAGVAFGSSSLTFKSKPLLSFSTLGCPKWTYTQVIDFAAKHGYDGIEIRGLNGEINLPKCPEFNSPENITASRKLAEAKNIKIVNLGASAAMHHADPVLRKKNLDEARQYIDLAKALNCPFMRVFPNDLPKDDTREATIQLIINGLKELGEYAKGSNVTVLLESHGDAVRSAELLKIMQQAEGPNVGLVWDIFNMWSVTKEPPAEVYQTLKKYIRHTHFKDANAVNGKQQYVLFGEGEAPNAETISSLVKGQYAGYYSFEWEKLWHPEIQEPEIAIAQFPKAIKKYFKA